MLGELTASTYLLLEISDIHPQDHGKILKQFFFQKNHSKDGTAFIFKIILIQQAGYYYFYLTYGETEAQELNNLPNIISTIARTKLGLQTFRVVLQLLDQTEFPNTDESF